MLKVGITGAIGSGKTTVSKIFQALGVPVFYADIESKKNYALPQVMPQIVTLFGDQSYTIDNQPDTKHIAKLAFSNPALLIALNEILHPLSKQQSALFMQKNKHFAYAIKEAAILFETQSDSDLDAVICVTATLQSRISRVMQRDCCTQAQVEQRMQKQWSQEEKIAKSHYIIDNEDTELTPQIIHLHNILLQRSKQMKPIA